MSAEYFNSIGGFSAGLPEVPVIDANGNVVTNVLTNGNVFANVVYASYYRYANGNPLSVSAGGSNTQLQYNNGGSFAGIPNVTFSGNVLSLGDVSSLAILGGDNGYFLQTDGEGNLTWAAGGGGGGNGTPGGANTQVQFNDSGTFGGDAGFFYNKDTNLLTVANLTVVDNLTATVSSAVTAGTVTTNAQPNITSVGTLTNLNVTNTVVANLFAGSGANLTNIPAANLTGSVPLAQQVSNAAQPNITSVGTLTGLTTSGNISATGNISALGTLVGGSLSISGTTSTTNLSIINAATFANALTANANAIVNFAVASDVNLGSISNVTISGGVNGYVLSTDGAGNLSWTAGGGGGNGTPGGSNTQIQYNDIGTFGGSPFFTFNEATTTVTVAGNLVANTIIMGSGAFRFSYSNVYAATTTSTSPNQVIYSVPAEDIAGIDFTVITTDSLGGSRQISKLTSVVLGTSLSFNDTSTMAVNSYLSDFSVAYDAGNIITPAQIVLSVTPTTANLLTHKMQVTTYEE
jgi:hypothetical protein